MGLWLTTPVLIIVSCISAQEADSSQAEQYRLLETKLDSLQQEISNLQAEIGDNITTADSFQAMNGLLADEAADTVGKIDDQRSRRRRLDALLEKYMKRPGVINFNGDATMILQGSFEEKENIATATGSFDLFVATRLGKQTLLFLDLEAIGGNGPNQNYETFTALNGDAGSTATGDGFDRMHVLEAWVEFSALRGAANFTVGKIDLTNYFDNNAVANDETSQFITGAFVNSAGLPVPGNTPGVRLRTDIKNQLFLQVGVVSTDNSGNRILERLFKIASTGFRLNMGRGVSGTYHVYGYLHEDANNAGGWGFSADQPTFLGIAFFGRWNKNVTELSNYWGIESAWSIGSKFETHILKQLLRVGVAYGTIKPVEKSLLKEHVTEIYVRHQLNRWTHISPHLQIVNNHAGSTENLLVLGFRTQFDF